MSYRVINADVLEALEALPDESVHCVVTSPPYYGLRDYGVTGQIGLEATPQAFIAKLTAVFREVRRVLRKDGTCWVNMGDSYAGAGRSGGTAFYEQTGGMSYRGQMSGLTPAPGLKPKDLMGMPWRLALSLQDDGWWLRQDIIWAKPNPMPESVADRCTKSHEYLFLLTKSGRYHFSANAIKEPCVRGDAGSSYVDGKTALHQLGRAGTALRKTKVPGGWDTAAGGHGTIHREGRTEAEYVEAVSDGRRNKRSVWTISTEAFPEAHFATFPRKLVEPCIRAGCPAGGTVLDPFSGSGTTGLVALAEGCEYIGIELSPEYAAMSERRLAHAARQPELFAQECAA